MSIFCILLGIIVLGLPFFSVGLAGCLFTILPAVLLFISGVMIDTGYLVGWILFGIAFINVIIKFIMFKISVSNHDKTSDSIYKKCKEAGVLSLDTADNKKTLLDVAGKFGIEDMNIAISHYERGKKSDGIGSFMAGFVIVDIIVLIVVVIAGLNLGGSNSNHGYDDVTCPVCHREFHYASENAKSIRWNNMCTNCYENYKYASDALKERPVG